VTAEVDENPAPGHASDRYVWLLISAFIAMALLGLVLPIGDDSDPVATAGTPDASDEVSDDSDDQTDSDDMGASSTEAAADTGSERFTISASGDIIIHGRVAEAAKSGDTYDFRPLFDNVKPLIESVDFAICHLESPLSSTNTDLSFRNAFRAPTQVADALKDTGFDSCSLASNHAYDSGESSVTSTIDQLTRVGLPHVGIAADFEQADKLWQFQIGETLVGHLAYTYGINARDAADVPAHQVARIDEAKILADAARQRANGSEFIIVSMHWGTEFSPELTDQQATLGPRLLASADIDLIVSHSAHVVQRVDKIDGEYIAYGLGNLLSNQSSTAPECPEACTLESQDGVLLEFTVDRQPDGSLGVVDVFARPTWVDVGGTWEIFDTEAVPISGAAFDDATLTSSAERTLTALQLP